MTNLVVLSSTFHKPLSVFGMHHPTYSKAQLEIYQGHACLPMQKKHFIVLETKLVLTELYLPIRFLNSVNSVSSISPNVAMLHRREVEPSRISPANGTPVRPGTVKYMANALLYESFDTNASIHSHSGL